MKIGFFEMEQWESDAILKRFPGGNVVLSGEKIDEMSAPKETDFDAISIFVNSHLTREVLAKFPNLKFIATRSTGYDHIDLAAAKERGIAVSYVPGYGDNTVAEFAFGLILNLTRKIYQAIDQIKENGSFSLVGLRGIDLKGKTIGVLGTGRIGREMVKIAKGFGMNVVAYDIFPSQEFAAQMGYEYLPLEEVLGRSDVISLHCPYNKDTHHLINQKNVGRIKKGAIIINTARGGLLETDALVMALQSGILAGAGLDVLEGEGETKNELNFLEEGRPQEEGLRTVLQNHILMEMPNVLITPHNAFNSQEALQRILNTTLDNVQGFLDNKIQNIVPE